MRSSPHRDIASDPHWLAGRVVQFVRAARDNHFTVGIQEEIDAVKTAEFVGVLNRHKMKEGLRTLLCSNAMEWSRYDELFDSYWNTTPHISAVLSRSTTPIDGRDNNSKLRAGGTIQDTDAVANGDEGSATEGEDGVDYGGASRRELTQTKDFRFLLNEHEMLEMKQWIEQLAHRMRRCILRRHCIAKRGRKIQVRRTMRNSLRYGGVPFDLSYQKRRRVLPRLVVILDVSRSMSVYSYPFLHFARGIVDIFADAEAFVFHTRLLHVTEALKERNMLRMKEKLTLLSAGWAGGTRIGESLQHFNKNYGRRFVDSRTLVIILSDGYDTGEPDVLADQLQWIKQRAKRIIWLNPLLGRERYEPTAGGMQAALPHIDLFLPAHNLDSLRRAGDYLMEL